MTTRTERRRSLRARAPDSLKMTLPGLADPARVNNLSAAGVCCTTPTALQLLSQVQVTFLLPSDGGPCEVTCTGAVVRCVRTGSSFESAIYFTQVDDTDRSAIDAYVASLRRAGQVA